MLLLVFYGGLMLFDLVCAFVFLLFPVLGVCFRCICCNNGKLCFSYFVFCMY